MGRLMWFTVAAMAVSPVLSETPVPKVGRPRQCILLVIGAEGNDEYGQTFANWAEEWRKAAAAADAELQVIGESTGDVPDRELLEAALSEQAAADCDRFWLVLIGHGTYDGNAAKFNLRGADVAAGELADWLTPVKQPTIVVNCASSSGPYINQLSAAGRMVITATKSGYEMNFARFGQYFASALNDLHADLDKDDQVSLLEAYLSASRRVEEFYHQDARLASEHALLDDNGDGLGTPASWFHGLRATRRAQEGAELDGARAHQIHLIASDRESHMPQDERKRRDALELQLAALRERKTAMSEEAYFAELESLLVPLARIYQSTQSGRDHPDATTEQDTEANATSDDGP